jgi:hypothetical protein
MEIYSFLRTPPVPLAPIDPADLVFRLTRQIFSSVPVKQRCHWFPSCILEIKKNKRNCLSLRTASNHIAQESFSKNVWPAPSVRPPLSHFWPEEIRWTCFVLARSAREKETTLSQHPAILRQANKKKNAKCTYQPNRGCHFPNIDRAVRRAGLHYFLGGLSRQHVRRLSVAHLGLFVISSWTEYEVKKEAELRFV